MSYIHCAQGEKLMAKKIYISTESTKHGTDVIVTTTEPTTDELRERRQLVMEEFDLVECYTEFYTAWDIDDIPTFKNLLKFMKQKKVQADGQ